MCIKQCGDLVFWRERIAETELPRTVPDYSDVSFKIIPVSVATQTFSPLGAAR
jgi:hypothetical protein